MNSDLTEKEIIDNAVAEALITRDKEWIEWGESQCTHSFDELIKRRCGYCWQERKEKREVK